MQAEFTLRTCLDCGQLFLFVRMLTAKASPIHENTPIAVTASQIAALQRSVKNSTSAETYWSCPSSGFEYQKVSKPAVTLSRQKVLIHAHVPQVFPLELNEDEWAGLETFIHEAKHGVVTNAFKTRARATALSVEVSAEEVPDSLDPHENLTQNNLQLVDHRGWAALDISFELDPEHDAAFFEEPSGATDFIVLNGWVYLPTPA